MFSYIFSSFGFVCVAVGSLGCGGSGGIAVGTCDVAVVPKIIIVSLEMPTLMFSSCFSLCQKCNHVHVHKGIYLF